MAKKKKYNKPILVPEAKEKIALMRFQVAKQLGYINEEKIKEKYGEQHLLTDEIWWDDLPPMHKSTVNGHVTKLLVAKAQQDMHTGNFR